MGANVILTDILDDVMLMGSLAAEIFVKNPSSQATAARLITASSQLLQVIHQQVGIPIPAPVEAPATPAS